jgi:hypothetical protein
MWLITRSASYIDVHYLNTNGLHIDVSTCVMAVSS